MYLLICFAVFLAAYLLNIVTITVGYHRGLAHRSLLLHPKLERLIVTGGIWVTGLDPKAWVCMHRMHHTHADGLDDPHSPVHQGLFGVLAGQLRSYERTLVALAKRNPKYTDVVADLPFRTHWLNRNRVWYLPYLLHMTVGASLWAVAGWELGLAYFAGMMSHPIQGWIVNALGHAVGGRNFETDDSSRNNHLAAWLILGEGFQNNHHAFPRSARFSYRTWEIDLGFGACRALEAMGALQIDRAHLLSPAAVDAYASTVSS